MSNFPLSRVEKHPLNEYRPPAAPSAYKLIKWKPVFDMIVAGHILGRTNKDLAAEFDYTEVHISNILRSDPAQTLIANAHKKIRENAVDKSVENLEVQSRIQTRALERVEEFLDNDIAATKSPFAYINAVKSFLPARAEIPSTPSVTVNVQNNNQVNNIREESLQRIATALEISD